MQLIVYKIAADWIRTTVLVLEATALPTEPQPLP